MTVLKVNNHDYSRYVERSGFGWSRNDIDSSATKRNTKTGAMRRTKICTKRKCTYKMINMPKPVLAQLDTDLSPASVSVTIDDLHGERTMSMYCSAFAAQLDDASTDEWSGATFTLVEM